MTRADKTAARIPTTRNYVICPASEHLHAEPLAIVVYPSARKGHLTAVCDCSTRVWLSVHANAADAMTFEDAQALGFAFSQLAYKDEPLSQEPGRRWVTCPHSGRAHPGVSGHALPVVMKKARKTQRKLFMASCSGCATTVFLGPRWNELHGLTLAEAQRRGMSFSG